MLGCEDFINILVSGLSILVTVLIGWQIYTVINFRAEKTAMKSEVAEIVGELKSHIDLLRTESNYTQSAITGDLAQYYITQQQDFKVVNYFLTSTMYALRNQRQDIADTNIRAVLEYGRNGLAMKEMQKLLVMELYYTGVKNYLVSDNAPKLESMLISIQSTG